MDVKHILTFGSFLGDSVVKNLPAMHENWVQSLGWEDPLEKGMATHSSILAGKTPWTEELGGRGEVVGLHGVAKSRT